jgi:hypothetical protein
VVRGVMAGETKTLPLDLWMDTPAKTAGRRVTFTVTLVGDKNNFTVPASVDLSKRRHIDVMFHSNAPGTYSALLELHRAGMKYPVAQVPMLVVSTPDPEALKKGIEMTRSVTAEDQQFTVFNLPAGAHHIEAQLEAQGSLQPVVSYVIDDANPRRFAFDTLTGTTRVGYSDVPEIGDASILGVNISVRSNYPVPCCHGSYTLRLRVSTDAANAEARSTISIQRVELKPPGALSIAETDLAMVAGDAQVHLAVSCPSCQKRGAYELYVFKSFTDRRGVTQQRLWTYAPDFKGTWSQVVLRNKEDSVWKFLLMSTDPARSRSR